MDIAISILPFLTLVLLSGSFYWPPSTIFYLKSLALSPDVGRITSGFVLFDVILDLSASLGLTSDNLADGDVLFFDELMSRMDVLACFGNVVPELARLSHTHVESPMPTCMLPLLQYLEPNG